MYAITLMLAPFIVSSCDSNGISTLSSCTQLQNITSGCWYDFTPQLNCGMIHSNPGDRLSIEWIDVTSNALLMLSWKDIPYIQRSSGRTRGRTRYAAHTTIDLFRENNIMLQNSRDGKDFYHCDTSDTYCSTFSENTNSGPIYFNILPSELRSGRIKFTLESPKTFIKPNQLSALKDLWDTCCRETFEYTRQIFNFQNTHCSWAISHPATKDNDFGWDFISTDSCEHIDNIICDKFGNVVTMVIQQANLQCTLPESFSEFTHLKKLALPFNNITGDISKLSKLQQLSEITLEYNNFYGTAPCWDNKDITHVNLEHNNITGIIPNCYSQYSNLDILILSNNPFSPQNFPSLPSNIKTIDLKRNNIHGEIDTPTHFNKLHGIDVSSNKITGTIPNQILNSPSLSYIDVSYNKLSGEIPFINENYTFVNLQNNQFSGEFVSKIQNMSPNSILDISHNNFTGHLPIGLFDIYIKTRIILDGNRFMCENGTHLWPRWIDYLHPNIGNCVEPHPDEQKQEISITNPVTDDTSYTVGIIVLILMFFAMLCVICRFIWYKIKDTGYVQHVAEQEAEMVTNELIVSV